MDWKSFLSIWGPLDINSSITSPNFLEVLKLPFDLPSSTATTAPVPLFLRVGPRSSPNAGPAAAQKVAAPGRCRAFNAAVAETRHAPFGVPNVEFRKRVMACFVQRLRWVLEGW